MIDTLTHSVTTARLLTPLFVSFCVTCLVSKVLQPICLFFFLSYYTLLCYALFSLLSSFSFSHILFLPLFSLYYFYISIFLFPLWFFSRFLGFCSKLLVINHLYQSFEHNFFLSSPIFLSFLLKFSQTIKFDSQWTQSNKGRGYVFVKCKNYT